MKPKKEKQIMPTDQKTIIAKESRELYPIFVYETDPVTKKEKLKIRLSDGSENFDLIAKVLKRATGSDDVSYSLYFLENFSRDSLLENFCEKMEHAFRDLSAMEPKDPTEALLASQFLSLNKAGLNLIRRARTQNMFYHDERMHNLGFKALNCANQTMQCFLKYKNRGEQKIQVVHLHNNDGGKAIVTQNLTGEGKGRIKEKTEEVPHAD